MRRSTLLPLLVLAAACAGKAVEPPPPPGTGAAVPPPVPAFAEKAPDWGKLPSPDGTVRWTPPTPVVDNLQNGLPLYFVRQGPTPLVTVMLVMPRGSATDPKGKAGLTALTMDLLDEGAGGRTALELGDELQRLGTDFGARTDVDHVLVVMNVIAENFGPSMKLFADVVQRPALSAQEFQRRKEQRIADALSNESEPAYGREVVMQRVLFGDGYAGDIPAGTRATLKALSLADVKAHYAKLVAPDGAAFVVVGGIDAAPAKQALDAAFGGWKGQSTVKPAALADKPAPPAIHLIDYPGASQSALAVVRRAEGEGTPEYFPAMVMNRAFGEAFTSRLNLNLREDKGYTYGARSVFDRWARIGYYGHFANVKAETTRASIDEIHKELSSVCGTRPLTDKERKEAVEGLLLGFPGRFERITDVAAQFVSLPLYARPTDWFGKWPERVQAVSIGQANQLAQKYCDPKSYVIVIAGDKKSVAPTLEGLELAVSSWDAQGRKLAK